MMHMVPQFVRQHDLDLIGRIAIKHGIAYYNATRIAQSHERSIGRGRFFAQLHRENAAHTGMGAFSKREQSLCQITFG